MTIIAERRKGMFEIYLCSLVLSVILLGVSIWMTVAINLNYGFVIAVCAVFCIFIGYKFWGIMRLPKIIISYQEGVLTFPEFTCEVKQVTDVEYRVSNHADWGEIIVTVDGKRKMYGNVNEVAKACERLKSIMEQG